MLHWQDVRYAFRLLRRSPGFSLLTIVVLAGGLGLAIFTFSFLHAAMLRPLPLPGGERIVRVLAAQGATGGAIDAADLVRMRPAIRTLDEVGVFSRRELVLGADGSRRAIGASTTDWRVFERTRTRPALGRGFVADDAARGAEPVIVLSDATWRAAFGGDTAIVGATVATGTGRARVIGVMPEGYGFPVATDAWLPIADAELAGSPPGRLYLQTYGRLADGASEDAAAAELSGLLARAQAQRPRAAYEGTGPARVHVRSFPMTQIGDEAPLLLAGLNGIACLILLLACVNVTNLLLARANERARETAVRLALGAPRGRLVMQGLWETVILCVVGGAAATLLAGWALGAIDRWAHAHLAGNLAFWWTWRFDAMTVVAAGVFVTLAIAALGAVVSARTTSVRVDAVLRDGDARAGSRGERRVTRLLVATQVGVVTLLLFFGVLAGTVARRVERVDFGMDTRGMLRGAFDLPADRYATADARRAFYQSVAERLAARAEVTGPVLRDALGDADARSGSVAIDGAQSDALPARAHVLAVQGELATLGVTTRSGRTFDAGDRANGAPVALVSQSLAGRLFPRGDAVGRRVRLAGIEEREARTIVGIVRDVPLGNPLSRRRRAEAVYVPLQQTDADGGVALFRHRGVALAGRAALDAVVAAIDPALPPPTVMTFDEVNAQMTMIARSVTRLFAACFAFALLLAVSGTYGLMARAIGRRTRELGVRRALGATDARVGRLLLTQAGRQLGVGALVALPPMLVVGALFSRYFPLGVGLAVSAGVLVTAAVLAVVLLATLVPTRRALRVPIRDALGRE